MNRAPTISLGRRRAGRVAGKGNRQETTCGGSAGITRPSVMAEAGHAAKPFEARRVATISGAVPADAAVGQEGESG